MVSRLQGEGIFSHYLEDVRAVRLILKLNKNRNYSSCFVWRFYFLCIEFLVNIYRSQTWMLLRRGKYEKSEQQFYTKSRWPAKGLGSRKTRTFFLFHVVQMTCVGAT